MSKEGNATVNVYRYEMAPPEIDEPTLEAAQQLLRTMSLEEVEERGDSSEESRIPYAHNPHFVGREKDFLRLAKILKAERGSAVITGIPGMGKPHPT